MNGTQGSTQTYQKTDWGNEEGRTEEEGGRGIAEEGGGDSKAEVERKSRSNIERKKGIGGESKNCFGEGKI